MRQGAVLVAIGLGALTTACDQPGRATAFGPLHVGGPLPSYAGSCYATDRPIGPTTPPGGSFYVHVIDDRLPATCLDEACGPRTKRVIDLGGHVIGASDGKLAKAFGVEARTRPERRIIVASDSNGRITSILVDRGITDLDSADLVPVTR